jgi:hypothetical protein
MSASTYRLTWRHRPDCLLADADDMEESILLVNLGPCPCSPGGERYEPIFEPVAPPSEREEPKRG